MSHVGVWKRIPGRGNGSCKNPETGAYLTYSKTGRFKEQQETWQAQGTSGEASVDRVERGRRRTVEGDIRSLITVSRTKTTAARPRVVVAGVVRSGQIFEMFWRQNWIS